ncbi:MAG: tetratricopeptide repeat protein, partial [Rhodospirillales bacterium]|nr:tetratricopeptide repeat protein [Rhodospirillales bacterium]
MNSAKPPYKPAIKKFRTAPVAPFTEAMRLFQTGKVAEAEKVSRKALKSDPKHVELLHLMGLIAFQQGKAVQAADYIGKAIAAGGNNNPAFHVNHGLALKTAGKLKPALTAYDRGLAMNANNAGAWNDRGNVLSQLGQLGEAESSYKRALDLVPNDAKAWANLGNVLVKLDHLEDAVEACQKATALNPKLAPAHNGLGNAFNALGKIDEAITAFETALNIDPGYHEALGNLASCYEGANRTIEARTAITQSGSALKDNPHLALIYAKCDRRDGNLEGAVELLEKIDRKKLAAALRRDVAFELSRLYDQLENPAGAFDAMSEGNQQMLLAEGVDESLGDSFLETLTQLQDWYTLQRVQSFSQINVKDNEPDPVFLVGFPRSGTTLLGQILDSHSTLVMIEERPMLNELVEKVRSSHGGYPDGIEALSDNDVADLRQHYFDAVDKECNRQPGQIIIDKFPLHLVHVGLILRVFPKARFIFALR